MRTWGTSWGEAWGNSWGSGLIADITDTHDGIKKRDAEHKKRLQRLREQLETAFDGQLGLPVQEALAEFIAPQVVDSAVVAPIDRVDWLLVWKRYDEVVRKLELAAEEDDEDALLLLS